MPVYVNNLQNSFAEALEILESFCKNNDFFELLTKLSKQLAQTFIKKNKILICGNGGSNCDAEHFAEEFTGKYRQPRRALPVIALSNAAHITCVGNDYGFAEIFSRGVEAYGQPGDWLIGLSTSGNSENVLRAMDTAKKMGLTTLALLGNDGGKILNKCDYEIVIPAKTSDRIQEMHMLILHVLIEGIERELFAENYTDSSSP